MRPAVATLVSALSLVACSASVGRKAVVDPEEVARRHDPDWTIISEPDSGAIRTQSGSDQEPDS